MADRSQTGLIHELVGRELAIERQKPMPIVYKGVKLDCGYRLDLLVDGKVVAEIKAVERIERVHEAQILSYLKLSGCKVGLLLNFHAKTMKDGIRRFIL